MFRGAVSGMAVSSSHDALATANLRDRRAAMRIGPVSGDMELAAVRHDRNQRTRKRLQMNGGIAEQLLGNI